MSEQTVDAAQLLRSVALEQASKGGKSQVTSEDILLRVATFLNSEDMIADHVEEMWSNPPTSLGSTAKRVRKIIATAELSELVLVGFTKEYGLYLVRNAPAIAESDEDEDEIGVEVVAA